MLHLLRGAEQVLGSPPTLGPRPGHSDGALERNRSRNGTHRLSRRQPDSPFANCMGSGDNANHDS